jgi:hypothetical protein
LDDANTRDTYETVHRVREAQRRATGRGVRVGILDKYFGFDRHHDLYAGGEDFVGDAASFERIDEHGHWMATTLREIARGAEVFALNVRSDDRTREADAIARAIDWAVERHLNVLTYSARPFAAEHRPKIDEAVKRAAASGIVTTFVHYPLEENLLPTGLFPGGPGEESRPTDGAIFHYDYNTLLLSVYEKNRKILDAGGRPRSGDDVPYFSISSTSPVVAGIVALMMEVRGGLPPAEYKRVLVETSRPFEYRGRTVDRVVDAPRALAYLDTMSAP